MSRIIDFDQHFSQDESPPTVKHTPADAPNEGTKSVAPPGEKYMGQDDFILNPKARQAYIDSRANYSPFNIQKEKVYPDYSKGDFVLGAECKKNRELANQVIKSMARELYLSYDKDLKRYDLAQEKFTKLTADEKNDPDDKVKAIIAIVAKGVPITKEQAVERAKIMFYEKKQI